MTNNTAMVCVPRDLLDRALSAIEQVGYQDKFIDYTFTREVKRELSGSLNAPAEDVRAVVDWPVAWADPKAFENFKAHLVTHEWMWSFPDAGLAPLYRHPAPQCSEVAAQCSEHLRTQLFQTIPPLPHPPRHWGFLEPNHEVPGYTLEQMKEYGAACIAAFAKHNPQ